jgi:hypothetical protein
VGFTLGQAQYLNLAVCGETLHFAFGDHAREQKATVMRWVAGSWELAGNAGFSDGTATSLKLACAGSTPYVAFMDSTRGDAATVMRLEGDSWVNVGSAGFSAGLAGQPSLAISGSTPYLAYTDEGNERGATVMSFNGSSWNPVGSPSFSPGKVEDVRLAFAGSTPYVFFWDYATVTENTGPTSTLMRFDGDEWAVEGTPGFLSAGDYVSLAISGTAPYVGFTNPSAGYILSVARYDGASWQVVGNSPIEVGTHNVLRFLGTTPYLAFGGGTVGAQLMSLEGNTWAAVGGAPFTSASTSDLDLAFVGTTPYVAFIDGANENHATVVKFE